MTPYILLVITLLDGGRGMSIAPTLTPSKAACESAVALIAKAKPVNIIAQCVPPDHELRMEEREPADSRKPVS